MAKLTSPTACQKATCEMSDYQRQASQLAIELAHDMGAEQAVAHYYHSQGFEVTVRQQETEQLEHFTEQGLSITAYRNGRKGSTSTNALDQDHIAEAVKKAVDMTQWTEQDPCAGLPDSSLMASTFHDLDLYHAPTMDTNGAIELAGQCEAHALEQDPRLTQSEGVSLSSLQTYSSMANTHGFQAEHARSHYDLSCVLLAKEKDAMQRDYEYTTSCDFKKLQNHKQLATAAAKKTLDRLGARKISTRTCPVIFNPNMARTIWGAMLQAISGGAQYRNQSFLQDSLDENILPEWINIKQDPHLPQACGSCNYDSEGVQTSTKNIIEQGIVKQYILNHYAARQLGLTSTGNAGGIHNIIIDGNRYDLNAMLQEMGQGLLVTELMGQGVNPTTGDYSRGAFGYWIEGGTIQYPVHEITIAGNLKTLLSNIHCLGSDIDQRSKIRCGSLWLGDMTVAGV